MPRTACGVITNTFQGIFYGHSGAFAAEAPSAISSSSKSPYKMLEVIFNLHKIICYIIIDPVTD